MGVRKRLNEILGLEDSVQAEKQRFVARVNQIIVDPIDSLQMAVFDRRTLFEHVVFELGSGPGIGFGIADVIAGRFNETLVALCALHKHIRFDGNLKRGQKWLSLHIENILSQCTCDIGVRWKDGFFYSSGAKELDEPLIGDTLTWLRDYPREEKDYRTALRHYIAGDSLPDVVKDCYSAVEGIARNILGNRKNLDNNKEALLAKLGLSNGWNALLVKYISYAHDYRHANEKRHEITKQEAEAYLYMTGLIIRLTIESAGIPGPS